MKRIKVLPSILMLIACIAVLGVGVFAIAPTQNTISGSITINAANNHLVLTVYKTSAVNEDGTEATQNKLVGPMDARAGAKLEITEALEFNTEKANTKEDVKPIELVIKIENKSDKELGAYFYNGLSTDTMPEVATEENVRTSYLFKANESDADEASLINTTLTGYRHLAPHDENTENDVTYMKITFKLNQFQEYTSSFNFPLNVEQYNAELDTSPNMKVNVTTSTLPPASQTISKDQANPTTFAGDLSFLVPDEGYYIGMNNIIYTPDSAQSATLLSDSNPVKFSFDLTANSETIRLLMELPEDTEITAEIMTGVGLLLFAGNYSSVEEVMAQEESELFSLGFAEAIGSTITVYETEETANITEFCLVYISFDDLTISLSTPAFKDSENLSIVTVETVENYNRVDLDFSTTATYTLNPSTDENITQNISITNTKITNFPEEAEAINIFVDIPMENIYLISSSEYSSLISEGSAISEIIESIEQGSVGYVRQSVNDGTGTKISIFYTQISGGSANLTCIVLSEQEEVKVNYTFEINIYNHIKYDICSDDSGMWYLSVTGMFIDNVSELIVPATYNELPVKEIVDSAFKDYTSLTTVDLSGATSLTSIGDYAFQNCNSLETVDLSGATSLTSIGSSAFYDCTGLTEITIPSNVTSIGNSAFSGCTGLTEITIPSNVTSIENYAFSGCTSLITADLMGAKNLNNIGTGAFQRCSKLTEITIPENVTIIGNSVFENCRSLTKVDLKGATGLEIYSRAFYNCSKLTEITIPENVTSIGNYVFNGCSGLIKIIIKSGVDLSSRYSLPTLSKAGYTFNGWYSTPYASGGTKVTEISADKYTEDTTYYAVFTANS